MKKLVQKLVKGAVIAGVVIGTTVGTSEAKAGLVSGIVAIAKPLIIDKAKDLVGKLVDKGKEALGGLLGKVVRIGIPTQPGVPPPIYAGNTQNNFKEQKVEQVIERSSFRNEGARDFRINDFTAVGAQVDKFSLKQRFAGADTTVARDGSLFANTVAMNGTKANSLAIEQDAEARRIYVASGASLKLNTAHFGNDQIGSCDLKQRVLNSGTIEVRTGELVLNNFSTGQ